MNYKLLLAIVGSLMITGCNETPSTSQPKTSPPVKREMRPETNSYLLNNNKLVCIGGSLYFAAWEEGGVVIRSPVINPYPPHNVTQCKGGIPLEKFGKLY